MLNIQALALNGEWENAFILNICFEDMKMSDHSVWAWREIVGFTNRLLLGSFTEKCLSKKLVYVTIHSNFFVRG